MKEQISEATKERARRFFTFYRNNPKEYIRAFYTGHIVPATYRWKRQIEKRDRKEKGK